jgi:hypothetical protein
MKIEYDTRRHPRLELVWEPEWTPRQISPHEVELAVDAHVKLRVRPQLAMPADYGFWIEHVMREDAPASTRLVQRAFEHGLSRHGWPIVFAHYQLVAESGEIVEERAGAFYRILHDGAEIVARLRGVTWADREPALRPYLVGGRVIWPSSDAALLYTLLGMDT